ncbi:hypothetical protein Q31a_31200 [Aureliella helgolandensis]|uniref:Uncharacterized protein n=1 Tax=Aureliella helgolandensis TaxID=2527968 RepID=A0A518G883_9BACT|nr:hypothetical protein Q31a_31200 [Aureliella helgolandensis]
MLKRGASPAAPISVEQFVKQVALGRNTRYSPPIVVGGERSDKRMTGVSSARLPELDSRLYIEDMLTPPVAVSTTRVFSLINETKAHPQALLT